MKALRIVALAVAVSSIMAGISSAQVQGGGITDGLHMACFVSNGTVYTISVDTNSTTYTMGSQSLSYAVLHMPAGGGEWHQGKTFGRAVQAAGLFPSDDIVKNASWVQDTNSRSDTMTFTTKHETQYVFASTNCPGWSNCPYLGGSPKHCWDQYETCCGYATMHAQCIPKNTDSKCCTWYAAATTCNATQSCCGGLGPGASSYASCCNQGSSCCTARSNGVSSCCPAGTTCCQGVSIGLCCAAGETCDPYGNRCVAATTTSTPAPSASPAPATTVAP